MSTLRLSRISVGPHMSTLEIIFFNLGPLESPHVSGFVFHDLKDTFRH